MSWLPGPDWMGSRPGPGPERPAGGAAERQASPPSRGAPARRPLGCRRGQHWAGGVGRRPAAAAPLPGGGGRAPAGGCPGCPSGQRPPSALIPSCESRPLSAQPGLPLGVGASGFSGGAGAAQPAGRARRCVHLLASGWRLHWARFPLPAVCPAPPGPWPWLPPPCVPQAAGPS